MLSTAVVIVGVLLTGALVYGAVMLFVEADAREMLIAPLQVEEAPDDERTHTAGSVSEAAARQDGSRAKPIGPEPGAIS